jgi:predicted AlkP superfamily pyrophosphatase or phosphodiesterase
LKSLMNSSVLRPLAGLLVAAAATSDPTVKYMHGSPWAYDSRIPFFFYGPAFIRRGTFPGLVSQQDMAPTLASLLGVPMPGTSSGRSLRAIRKPAAGRPRLIVLAVLDGMRFDYFERHAAAMSTLDRLRRQGAWFTNARINYIRKWREPRRSFTDGVLPRTALLTGRAAPP